MKNAKKVGIVSLGCPKARVDSEFFLGVLRESGYEIVATEYADIVVINTCAFIRPAEEESVEEIEKWLKLKAKGKVKKIGVVGCLVEKWRGRLLKRFPNLDFVLGTDEFELISKALSSHLKIVKNRPPQKIPSPFLLPRFLTTFPFAYVKIAEGCNRRCAFCTIPSIRGRHRYRPIDEIVDEVRALATLGVKEVVLISQDLTQYPDLHLLIEKLEEVKVEWIRLLYLHPAGVTKRLVKAIAGNPKVVPYVELPIQHISDRLLRLMGRAGGRIAVERSLDLLRSIIPDIFIRTEIIVGYPTETEKEFQELLDFIDKEGFERIGVFKFWPEKGTKAFSIEPKVAPEEIERRFEEATTVAYSVMARAQDSLIGKKIDVLIDFQDADVFYGRSVYDAPEIDFKVILKRNHSENLKLGNIVKVKTVRCENLDLISEPVALLS